MALEFVSSGISSHYHGLIQFEEALALEEEAFLHVQAGGAGRVIGFQSRPVITLGVRGKSSDIEWSAENLAFKNFRVIHLERGGQATLHNPGQLVIFPVLEIKAMGARAWVDLLLRVSRETLEELGKESRCRAGSPGLFTDQGKIVSVGIRVRQGISTHGLSINVCNDLADFAGIKACGVAQASMDRVSANSDPEAVFKLWQQKFEAALALGLTCSRNLRNLDHSSAEDARL